jgi:hypothetical protein
MGNTMRNFDTTLIRHHENVWAPIEGQRLLIDLAQTPSEVVATVNAPATSPNVANLVELAGAD